MKKRSKILAAAIALLGFSTAASITGTVAWFTASNVVNVSGMQIKAEVEQGIVISNEATTKEWKTDITASHDGLGLSFVPTSTYNVSDWWHAYSTNADQAVTNDTIYTAITPSDNVTSPAMGTEGDGAYGYVEGNSWKHVYLLNKFYVKASTLTEIEDQDIFIKNVVAKVGENDAAQKLSKGLRVAFIAKGETTPLIFAPVTGADASNDIALTLTAEGKKATSQSITAITNSAVETNLIKTNYDIPAYDAADNATLEVSVYIYFEGEDDSIKSANIESATLEALSVSFKLGNKLHVNP